MPHVSPFMRCHVCHIIPFPSLYNKYAFVIIVINDQTVTFLLFTIMDSRVVRSEVQENDEHYPHIVPLEQGMSYIWK